MFDPRYLPDDYQGLRQACREASRAWYLATTGPKTDVKTAILAAEYHAAAWHKLDALLPWKVPALWSYPAVAAYLSLIPAMRI